MRTLSSGWYGTRRRASGSSLDLGGQLGIETTNNLFFKRKKHEKNHNPLSQLGRGSLSRTGRQGRPNGICQLSVPVGGDFQRRGGLQQRLEPTDRRGRNS